MARATAAVQSLNPLCRVEHSQFARLDLDLVFSPRFQSALSEGSAFGAGLTGPDQHLDFEHSLFSFGPGVFFGPGRLDEETMKLLWDESGMQVERVKGIFRTPLNSHKWTIQG